MQQFIVKDLNLSPYLPHLNQSYSFNLHSGDFLFISGNSGVGKSLLLKALADLIVHQGSIFLNQDEQQSIAAHLWRKKVMLVPAESQWWHESVQEHFLQLDINMLNTVGLPKQILTQTVHDLSSGEKQRLAILRALQHQPSVLLLDEATANLDAHSKQLVEQMLLEYVSQHQAIIIWVSHDQKQQHLATQNLSMKQVSLPQTE